MATFALILLTGAAPAEDGVPTVVPREPMTTVFADKQLEFRFTVKATKAWKGTASWSLSAANDRTLAFGEVDVVSAPHKPGEVIVKLHTPEVKPGAALKTRLQIRLIVAGGKKPLATHDRTLWIFPEDPFVNRQKWLKEMRISLFDPEKTTAESLKKLEIPFEEINNVAALAEIKEGLVLVGPGVSFKDHPELAEKLTLAASTGLPVLCLAPSGGSFTVPGAAVVNGPKPRTMTWRRHDHIATLDERLDATFWPPEGEVVVNTLSLKAEDAAVVAVVGHGADDWPWFEAEFAAKNGRLIVCGFRLFGKAWDASPTPRYLFARLLEEMTPKIVERDPPEKEKGNRSPLANWRSCTTGKLLA